MRSVISWGDYAQLERDDHERVSVKLRYIDMAGGDIAAGVLLSQIVYWHLPSKSGQTRLRVERDGVKWLAKSRHEWMAEVRLNPRQVDRCLGILRDKGLLITRNMKFGGTPTTHIRLNTDKFLEAWLSSISRDGEVGSCGGDERSHDTVNSSSPGGENHLTASGDPCRTDTTSETTAESSVPNGTGPKALGSKPHTNPDTPAELRANCFWLLRRQPFFEYMVAAGTDPAKPMGKAINGRRTRVELRRLEHWLENSVKLPTPMLATDDAFAFYLEIFERVMEGQVHACGHEGAT